MHRTAAAAAEAAFAAAAAVAAEGGIGPWGPARAEPAAGSPEGVADSGEGPAPDQTGQTGSPAVDPTKNRPIRDNRGATSKQQKRQHGKSREERGDEREGKDDYRRQNAKTYNGHEHFFLCPIIVERLHQYPQLGYLRTTIGKQRLETRKRFWAQR